MTTSETLDMLIHRAISGGDDTTRLALTAVRDVFVAEMQGLLAELETFKIASAIRPTVEDCLKLSDRLRDLTAERDHLARWKQEHLTVESWWQRIDAHVRVRKDGTLGSIVADKALELIQERDVFHSLLTAKEGK